MSTLYEAVYYNMNYLYIISVQNPDGCQPYRIVLQAMRISDNRAKFVPLGV